MDFRKCLVAGFAALALLSFAVLPAAAEEAAAQKMVTPAMVSDSGLPEPGETAVSLEQAIKLARETFQVPAVFDKFSNGFNQSEQGAFWELHWMPSGDAGGYMDVRVNAQSGEIWSMSMWNPPADDSGYRGLPAYSREQARTIAEAIVQKVHPERFRETVLQPGRDYTPPLLNQPRGAVEYSFNFVRQVNGVPYMENSIEVRVNGDTGEVISLYLNWDDSASFPSAADSIAVSQAEQIFREQAAPQLYYFRPRISGGSEVPLKLVYTLPGQRSQVLIDALTGEVLDNDGYYYGYRDMAGGSEKMMADAAMNGYQLNPVEISAVEAAKNLLSRETALAKATAAVAVPDDFVLKYSRLEQDYLFTDNKFWHFSWEGGEEPERKWLEVTVNAKNGELVSFYWNDYRLITDTSSAGIPRLSEDEVRTIAESFIKKVQASKWEQVVFRDAQPFTKYYYKEKPQLPDGYTFNWTRVARDGIQYPDNGFTVTVDAVTGEINSYQMSWYDVEFPTAQGVMEVGQAADRFLQEAPLTRSYLRLWPGVQWPSAQEEAKIYLTYHLTNDYFTMLDAFTGEILNSEGKPATVLPQEGDFTDLAGHPAREAVEMLAGAGIISKVAGPFRPEDTITQAELIAMLVRAGTYSGGGVQPLTAGSSDEWYKPYYEKAVLMGILSKDEQPDPDAPVTNILLSRLSIHAIDLYRVARLSDIFALDFKDADEIPVYLRGHAAIAVGMGLMELKDGYFNSQGLVSRGEAAVTLVKLLNSWK
ncbi:MAG: YcdB/YcdC domain-containing protein [Pelotomaculum sp.]|jgi:hypothetical protein